MNELAIHIEYLLLSHDTVIVPTLGEFRTMQTPARWIAGENLFIPPVRNVHFNSAINFDPEEIFLQSLANIYNLSPEEALKRCEEMVSEFHKTLVTEGSVDFGSIGVFSLEDDAEVTMASCECGITTPSYYGLDAIHFNRLQDSVEVEDEKAPFITHEPVETKVPQAEEKVEVVQEAQAETTEEVVAGESKEVEQPQVIDEEVTVAESHDNEHVTFRVRKSIVRYVAAIAATIALFFVVKPTMVTNKLGSTQASMPFLQPHMVQAKAESTSPLAENAIVEETDSFDAVLVDITQTALNEGYDFTEDTKVTEVESSTTAAPANPATETAVSTPSKAEKQSTATATNAASKVDKQSIATSSKGSYFIVLASSISKTNALNYIDNLGKKGVKASLFEKGSMRRVVVGGFATKDDARTHLKDMRKTHSDFASAWVIELEK
ncbi:MAG: SPOR domain-containing protein [Bacteroidaceae bacterium]|nr:SPOR domain-containing protein [Bacteroidaceae bacterium]